MEIVMGVSDWTDQTGEELRHLVGNAIMEQAFEKYEYRKVLPKGTHQIGKEKIVTKKDLWDCVPKEEKIKFKMEDGKVFVDLERQYLPGYAAPSVTYQQKQVVSEAKSGLGAIGKGILAVLLAGGAALVGRIAYVDAVRKKRRRRRRK